MSKEKKIVYNITRNNNDNDEHENNNNMVSLKPIANKPN